MNNSANNSTNTPINKILIANRGAIAKRIMRTIKELGKYSIAVYADDDLDSKHIDAADQAISLGAGNVSETYINQQKILQIALETGADAIHPGYGFLSENAEFERRCEAQGVVFLGPTSDQMEAFGLKHSARQLALENNVPMLPGSPLLVDAADAIRWAAEIGYPVMLKSTAGGGGIGMRLCQTDSELNAAFSGVQQLASNNFGNAGLFLERFVANARHIEVQVIGDGKGKVIALGTRDCSAQRRQQKVLEECPAPGLSAAVTAVLTGSAESLLSAVNYRSAGTVEYVYDEARESAYFLEVNTRIQVEHGVTEMVFGVDLVAWQIQLAEGKLPPLDEIAANLNPQGHAVQARIYAEDPALNFQPSPGLLTHVEFPAPIAGRLRVDTWVESGVTVSAKYDPLIGKVIAHGATRDEAREGLRTALEASSLYGTETNLYYLAKLLAHAPFVEARLSTSMLETFSPPRELMRVLRGGTLTTVQDYPGRVGYWDIGVPPSGPFDDLSFRLGNTLLGNAPSAAGLEITNDGPVIEFSTCVEFLLAGAAMTATLDGTPIRNWQVYRAEAGSKLDVGTVVGRGLRSYLMLAGGIQCPLYLASRSTFTLGQFGGHGGRALRTGDVLGVIEAPRRDVALETAPAPIDIFSEDTWQLHVIYGPHGAPDFFTSADIETFFETDYEVHFNSSRTGVRLLGPKPAWAREDGGEAGLHPSNIHDNAYAVGTVDFTGDMPVILGPDGPSLGGFVCPATIIRADLWKLGQLRPGDKIRFVPVSHADALTRWQGLSAWINDPQSHPSSGAYPAQTLPMLPPLDAVIAARQLDSGIALKFRASGDDYLLLEVGEQVLEISLRFRVHAIHLQMIEEKVPGVLEMTPGIRSLQVHYEPEICARDQLIEKLASIAHMVDETTIRKVPSRIVHLPLSFDDPACQEAIDKYQQSVRPDAPWCPSNLEFIRRINGLDAIADVEHTVFDATYLVLGLGDVYLGAPVATPLDPGHRLVTTKYNPARTWTAENSVGIGGAYLCIYGMEGPGGYQFVGRTLQMWNRYRQTADFTQPWLLRFFDQIKFYPVTHEALEAMREDFVRGRLKLEIEESHFDIDEHEKFVQAHEERTAKFVAQRQEAFAQELAAWQRDGLLQVEDAHDAVLDDQAPVDIPTGHFVVESHVSGSVWKFEAELGEQFVMGQTLLLVESMKMELEVKPDRAGTLVRYLVNPGQQIVSGQPLALFMEKEYAHVD